MAVNPLPSKPSLEHLRKEAKSLLAAWCANEPEATRRFAEFHPEHPDPGTACKLADAQLVVARGYGYSTWPKLKRYVEIANPDWKELLRLFVLAAVSERNRGHAEAMLAQHPELAEGSWPAMLVSGNADDALAELEADATLATTRCGPREWEPIQYVCLARFQPQDAAMDERKARITRRLIEMGANANSAVPGDNGAWPAPVLYGACGMNGHPRLTRVLLEAGAKTADGESIYHAAQEGHLACLEVLAEFGADFSTRQEPWGNTPLYFLMGHEPGNAQYDRAISGVRWLLQHGADPNVTSYASGEAPLHLIGLRGHGVDVVAMFAKHGADVSQRSKEGRTPYGLAVAHGNVAGAEALLAHGAKVDDATAADRFEGACSRADEIEARGLLEREPALRALVTADGGRMICAAASRGNAAALRLMVALGFSVASRGWGGSTPLHLAVWNGHLEAARALVESGAAIEARCEEYGATPLGWATHGSTNSGRKGEYLAIVRLLLDAGAQVDAKNKWGEPPIAFAGAEIRALLQERGALL